MNYSSVLKVRRLFNKERPDIIHLHSFPAATLGRISIIFKGIPHVYHLHTEISKAHSFSLLMKTREKLLNLMNTQFIAVSEYVKNDYADYFKTIYGRFEVLSGGVCDEALIDKMEARKDLELHPEKKYLAVIASLTPHKNHHYLFEILSKLDNFELLIVGDGPLAGELQSMSANMGLEKRIHFLGIREDIHKIFSASDAAILTSTREGLGLSLIEAQRAGIPCFGTPSGGIPEVIRGGKNGFIIPIDNSTKAAQVIGETLSNAQIMKTFSINSRNNFEKKYSMNHYYEKLLNLYKEIS